MNTVYVDWAQIARDNYDKIAEVMEDIHLQNLPYQVDIYLYPDGEVDDFINPGGNSWRNDDHSPGFISSQSGNISFTDSDSITLTSIKLRFHSSPYFFSLSAISINPSISLRITSLR